MSSQFSYDELPALLGDSTSMQYDPPWHPRRQYRRNRRAQSDSRVPPYPRAFRRRLCNEARGTRKCGLSRGVPLRSNEYSILYVQWLSLRSAPLQIPRKLLAPESVTKVPQESVGDA